MAEELLSTFRAAFERSIEAFNRGDLDAAVGGLPEDLEWHSISEDPERAIHRGPDEVKGWFGGFHDIFEEWRVEVQGFEELGDGIVLAHYVLRGRSRGAGVPVGIEVFEIWEFEALRPRRVRQFRTRDGALSAAADS